MVEILFTSVLKFWLSGAFSWHWVDFVSNCTVGLFLGTKLAQFPLRPRWSQQKKRSLNSVPELAARPPPLTPGPQNNPIVQQETTPTSLPLELKMANFSFLGTVRLLLAKSIWKTASNPCSGTQASTVYSEYTPQVACEKCRCQFANQVEGKFR